MAGKKKDGNTGNGNARKSERNKRPVDRSADYVDASFSESEASAVLPTPPPPPPNKSQKTALTSASHLKDTGKIDVMCTIISFLIVICFSWCNLDRRSSVVASQIGGSSAQAPKQTSGGSRESGKQSEKSVRPHQRVSSTAAASGMNF